MKNKIQLFVILNILLSFISCSFFRMDDTDSIHVKNSIVINPKDYPENNTSMIIGTISFFDKINHPVVVAACSVNSKKETADHLISYVILNQTNEFIIYLPDGEYFIYTISDLNNDFIFENNEITGVHGIPDKISLLKNEIKTGITIQVGNTAIREVKFPEKIAIQHDYNSVEYTTFNGQIKKIYSEIFSLDNAKIGWWHPSLFVKTFGANIYLQEEYDPQKIPVLFIHGAQGSPYDWVHIYVNLDKKIYQPMFFYYPSGLRLSMLSELLYIRLKEIENKFKFKKIYIAAHSMGGLVSRCMLTSYCPPDDDIIKLYVTFATPWSGFEFADAALKTSPYVLPSWIDISSTSMFIKTTLEKNIPPSVDFYLFFGKYDKTSKDKAIDSRVYKDAKGIFGFNSDHNEILKDKEAMIKFNEILNKENLTK